MTDKLLEPKIISFTSTDGKEKSYTISKLPATVGIRLVSKLPGSTRAMVMTGDPQITFDVVLELFSYVETADKIRLVNETLINNHVHSWEDVLRIVVEMSKYNCSFFQSGRLLSLLRELAPNIRISPTQTLTDLLEPSLENGTQHTTN